MNTKKVIIGIIVVVLLIAGWYLISPVFRVVEVDEPSPLAQPSKEAREPEPVLQPAQTPQTIKDSMDTMDASTRVEFEKQVEAAKGTIVEMADTMPSQATVVSEGDFKPRAHDVKGKVVLIEKDGKKTLRFENFETINGPNLHIYLSSQLGDDDYIDLGKIKATKGNVNYELENTIDTTKYNKVLVWCVPFRVLFSYAELK